MTERNKKILARLKYWHAKVKQEKLKFRPRHVQTLIRGIERGLPYSKLDFKAMLAEFYDCRFEWKDEAIEVVNLGELVFRDNPLLDRIPKTSFAASYVPVPIVYWVPSEPI